jgi:hypothetical protein
MDNFLWDTQAKEGILLQTFYQNEPRDYVDIVDTFFENMKSTSTAPLFGHGSRSTQLGETMSLYNLKSMYGLSDMFFSALLR